MIIIPCTHSQNIGAEEHCQQHPHQHHQEDTQAQHVGKWKHQPFIVSENILKLIFPVNYFQIESLCQLQTHTK